MGQAIFSRQNGRGAVGSQRNLPEPLLSSQSPPVPPEEEVTSTKPVPGRGPLSTCTCHLHPKCPPTPISAHLSFPRVERTRNALNRSTRSGLTHPPASSPHPWSPLLTRYCCPQPRGMATAAGGRQGVRGQGEPGTWAPPQLQVNVPLLPTSTPSTPQPHQSFTIRRVGVGGEHHPYLLAARCSHLPLSRH